MRVLPSSLTVARNGPVVTRAVSTVTGGGRSPAIARAASPTRTTYRNQRRAVLVAGVMRQKERKQICPRNTRKDTKDPVGRHPERSEGSTGLACIPFAGVDPSLRSG